MAIPNDLNSKLNDALIESTDTAGEVVLRVANVDGSSVGAPVGGATETTLSELNDKVAASSVFTAGAVANGTTDNTLSCGVITSVALTYDTNSEIFSPLQSESGVLSIKIFDAGDAAVSQYAWGSGDSTTGIMFGAIRNDSNTSGGVNFGVSDLSKSSISVDAAGSVRIVGNIAHDAVDAGSPLKIGGYASATAPTAVSADGDRVNAWFDLNGRLQIGDGAGSITIDNSTLSVVGGGLEATALRVTIASDSTGVLSVDDNGGSLTVDGSVTANQNNKTSATPSSVSNSASSFTVFSSNSSAVGRTIYNDSSTDVYIKFGTTASTSDFTHKMSPSSLWELPQPLYNGRIDAIASAATGSLRITEW